ncbi:ArgP/LysG family DNA-binding transcriptional regulator [Brevibacterium litoralis]|uniref:ArgP/LysG family DNA-binding transcriptional regulator n=1 Tax=Brevibacterium litoralis TaxID=3138935 RepID=UPI0032EF38BF
MPTSHPTPPSVDPALATTLAAVVDEGTFEAAADALHITPSAVSQRIKLLEKQLGQRLVVRANPVRTTRAGRAVVRYARLHGLLEAETLTELGLDTPEVSPTLPIAVNADSMATWFIDAIATFTRAHHARIELLREDQGATTRLLRAGTAVAAVTSSPDPAPGCTVTPLGELAYTAVASRAWWDRWVDPPLTSTAAEAPSPPGTTGPSTAGPSTERAGTAPRHDIGLLTDEVLGFAPRLDYNREDGLQIAWLRERGLDPATLPTHYIPSTHDLVEAVRVGIGWAMLMPHQLPPALLDAPVGTEVDGLILLGGEPVSTLLYWQIVRTPSTTLDALTNAVLERAHASLVPFPER